MRSPVDICSRSGPFAATVVLICCGVGSWAYGAENNDSAVEQRNRLVETVNGRGADAVPTLVQALEDENEIVRRTAAHLLVKLGEAARPGFEAALKSPDVAVRLVALNGLAALGLLDPYWPEILLDVDPVVSRHVQLVLMKEHPLPDGGEMDRLMNQLTEVYRKGDAARRRHVVEILAALDDMPPASRRVLILATKDEEADIRHRAYDVVLDQIAADWDEAAELLEAALSDSSKDVKDIGQEMRWKLLQVKQVRLPKEGWRFRIDPEDVGRDQAWYKPDFDDGEWRDDVPIEASWMEHMRDVYNGVGWYRRNLAVPEAPDGNRVYLHFEGVDEEAWVWLNGTFVGEHAMGKDGWNVPFVLDVTEAVKLGAENQVAVRARNTSGGAGIWLPVHLRVLNTEALSKPSTRRNK